jgi:hypothetical protein
MLSVTVNIKDLGASAALQALLDVMEHRAALHENMARAVEGGVQDHLRGLNTRSPNTHYYARAARSTEVSADADSAEVSVPHIGAALRFHGGRVNMKEKHLALPTKEVPIQGSEKRMIPREMGLLAFLPARKGADPGTRGYLVSGVEKLITAGKRAGQKRVVPVPKGEGGKLYYVLRRWTDHDPDPTVLPTQAELDRMAREGAAAFIKDYT